MQEEKIKVVRSLIMLSLTRYAEELPTIIMLTYGLMGFLWPVRKCTPGFTSGVILSPRGHFSMSGNIFDHYNWYGKCYWQLVDKGQGCC